MKRLMCLSVIAAGVMLVGGAQRAQADYGGFSIHTPFFSGSFGRSHHYFPHYHHYHVQPWYYGYPR